MPWREGLLKPFFRNSRGDFVTRESSFLQCRDPPEDLFRCALLLLIHGMFKRAPAEQAALVAPQGGGHLDAAVAVDPVKLVLIAHLATGECRLAPEAGLYRCAGVGGEELVSLSFQGFTW
jgi:hypothetical protein